MKPLILGMGPSRSHPSDAWHPDAHSTINLSCLILGPSANWSEVERHFDIFDLNRYWHWVEGVGDAIHAGEAEATLMSLVASDNLRSGRKVFLLGKQVTDFVMSSLRCRDTELAVDAWRKLPKCSAVRLRANDSAAKQGAVRGFYDFAMIPVWHPRILWDREISMPPGWQQRMMNVMRAAAGLLPMKFNSAKFARDGRGPVARQPLA